MDDDAADVRPNPPPTTTTTKDGGDGGTDLLEDDDWSLTKAFDIDDVHRMKDRGSATLLVMVENISMWGPIIIAESSSGGEHYFFWCVFGGAGGGFLNATTWNSNRGNKWGAGPPFCVFHGFMAFFRPCDRGPQPAGTIPQQDAKSIDEASDAGDDTAISGLLQCSTPPACDVRE